MTRFVSTDALVALISKVGLHQFMLELRDQIAADFRRWNDFEKSARLASHSDVGVIELMPISDQAQYGFKYVNGHPSNVARELSTVMAFGALADVDTGFPRLVSELTLATGIRTAVTSALAAEHLMTKTATSMGMIGCGAQSEFQALAFHKLLGINDVRVFDIDAAAMKKFERNLRAYKDLNIRLAKSTEDAVRDVDILTSVTADKSYATIITPNMVRPGMHINGIGGDCPGKTEIHPDVLQSASIFVEYEPQSRIEGDVQQLPHDHPVIELWTVLAGEHVGRREADEITVFDSVGFALEDFSTMTVIDRLTQELDIGEKIELIPDLANSKDLYSLLDNEQVVSSGRYAA